MRSFEIIPWEETRHTNMAAPIGWYQQTMVKVDDTRKWKLGDHLTFNGKKHYVTLIDHEEGTLCFAIPGPS